MKSRLLSRSIRLGATRNLSSKTTSSTPAFAFDLDGCLLRGKEALPGVREKLRAITARKDGGDHPTGLPYCYLTNGGGVTEAVKAAQLSELFQLPVRPEQVIVSHTPMRDLVPRFRDERVLVVGRHDVKSVALSYGFKHVSNPVELSAHYPNLTPHVFDGEGGSALQWHGPRHQEVLASALPADRTKPCGAFAAVLVFSDPLFWYRDLQLCLDVLAGHVNAPHVDCFPQPALFFSNPDFVFSAQHTAPRLAQGAFRVALAALFEELTGRPLQYTNYGKPMPVTYRYAEGVLQKEAQRLGYSGIHHYYGMGDNPASDIRGANSAGSNWTSVLVRTGTIQVRSDPLERPALDFPDAPTAIHHILTKEVARAL